MVYVYHFILHGNKRRTFVFEYKSYWAWGVNVGEGSVVDTTPRRPVEARSSHIERRSRDINHKQDSQFMMYYKLIDWPDVAHNTPSSSSQVPLSSAISSLPFQIVIFCSLTITVQHHGCCYRRRRVASIIIIKRNYDIVHLCKSLKLSQRRASRESCIVCITIHKKGRHNHASDEIEEKRLIRRYWFCN